MDGGNTLWLSAQVTLGSNPCAFDAFRDLWKHSCDGVECDDWWGRRGGIDLERVLSDAVPAPPITGAPREREGYLFERDSEAAAKPELEAAHPGDTADEGEPEGRQRVFTKAARGAGAVFFGPAQDLAVRSAYPGQLLFRLDPLRKQLIYDCFEARPVPLSLWQWPLSAQDAGRLRKEFDSVWEDAEEDGESECPFSDEEEEAPKGAGGDDEPLDSERSQYFFMDALCYFRDSRLLRLRVPFDDVVGARLVVEGHTPQEGDVVEVRTERGSAEVVAVHRESTPHLVDLKMDSGRELLSVRTTDTVGDPRAHTGSELHAVLVLDLRSPPGPLAFAARAVRSRRAEFNAFAPTGDWTPDSAASTCTRHFVTGVYPEMRELAEHLAAMDSRIAELLRLSHDDPAPPASAFAAAPPSPRTALAPHLRPPPSQWGPVEGLHVARAAG
eukprot:TRINITY_DN35623_c0_g1_i1.p1 TRINITY_DN35623_c0_g1~~TRINITY_DN35623_c0_g1_i1.p1  ORF type:complete len:463 (+),score=159.06 TRINITY_DN35623_c0_g1_i1:66-1391(+)